MIHWSWRQRHQINNNDANADDSKVDNAGADKVAVGGAHPKNGPSPVGVF